MGFLSHPLVLMCLPRALATSALQVPSAPCYQYNGSSWILWNVKGIKAPVDYILMGGKRVNIALGLGSKWALLPFSCKSELVLIFFMDGN